MRTRAGALLCELHAHTTWSDGDLSIGALVDLYGRNGFDVLCVTDHTLRPGQHAAGARHVDARSHDAYLDAIRTEAERARAAYDLIVLPGLELTYDDFDPARAAHAVAVGLESFVPLDEGLEPALARARAAGSALIAAHPYTLDRARTSSRGTGRFEAEREVLAPLVDRFELVNRHELFAWVAEARLPAVASGDFHRLEHLATWKTALPCHKDPGAVVDYLRSARPAYVLQLPGDSRGGRTSTLAA